MDTMSAVCTEKKNTTPKYIESDKPGHSILLQQDRYKLPKEYRDFLIITGKLVLLPVVVTVGVFTGIYAGFCKTIETIHNLLIEEE